MIQPLPLRDTLAVAKVGIERSSTALPRTGRIYSANSSTLNTPSNGPTIMKISRKPRKKNAIIR
jgi:hypothetical protein